MRRTVPRFPVTVRLTAVLVLSAALIPQGCAPVMAPPSADVPAAAVSAPAAAPPPDSPTVTSASAAVHADSPAREPTVANATAAGGNPINTDAADRSSFAGRRWACPAAGVRTAMKEYHGSYSAVIIDLSTGASWEHNADATYHPASLIKLPVTLYAEHRIFTGKLTWDTLLTYAEADFESPGGGALETAPFGSRYPVSNLVDRALRYSNNIAVNIMGRTFGWEEIRRFARAIDAELLRGPRVTAWAVAGWWRYLWQLQQTDPDRAAPLLNPLRETPYRGRIAAGVPENVPLWHKFGTYDGYDHDSAMVLGPDPYVLVVLTHGRSPATAEEAIAQVVAADKAIARAAAAVWDCMAVSGHSSGAGTEVTDNTARSPAGDSQSQWEG